MDLRAASTFVSILTKQTESISACHINALCNIYSGMLVLPQDSQTPADLVHKKPAKSSPQELRLQNSESCEGAPVTRLTVMKNCSQVMVTGHM